MKKMFLSFIIVALLCSCSSSNDFELGKEQLEQQGYTDVKDTGYNWFCCDKDEHFSTGFECKNRKGEIVKGCFCSNIIGKGVTIRFE